MRVAGLELALVNVGAAALVCVQSESIVTRAGEPRRSHDTLMLAGVTRAQVLQAAREAVLAQTVTRFTSTSDRVRTLFAQVFATAVVNLAAPLLAYLAKRTGDSPLEGAVCGHAHRVVIFLVAAGNFCECPHWKCLHSITLRLPGERRCVGYHSRS